MGEASFILLLNQDYAEKDEEDEKTLYIHFIHLLQRNPGSKNMNEILYFHPLNTIIWDNGAKMLAPYHNRINPNTHIHRDPKSK
ncbi:hypothetical protein MHK_005313 [Candidatus Magnetomorum sp. HK-1]|nr:hypothetical protein MHK_005313 [Candidatus Magnetomorum sp. HK-1]